jgi:hypothetical protein
MQIFGKKTRSQEIEALTRRRDRLAGKTQTAWTELQRATEEQIKLLTESDDDNAKAETNALRRVETAAAMLKALEAALAKIEEEISDVQNRADQEREALERNSAADAIEKQVLAFEKTVEPALTALRAFSKAASELNHLNFEVDAISRYAHLAASELEIASSLAVAELRSKATSVRSGQSQIPRRAPPPAPLPPPPEVQKIWTIQPIAWTQGGRTEIRDLNEQVDLSPALAKKAIAIGAAVSLDDPRFNKQVASWRRYHGYGAPDLEQCVRLDDATESAASREQPRPEVPIVHSALDPNFEILDRGKPFVIRTPAGNPTPGEAA